MAVTATRSPMRLLMHVLLAIPAILLAVDMTVSNRFYPLPDHTLTDSGEQQLTVRGRAELRRDRVVATGLFVGGVWSTAWAMRELVRARPLLRADGDGVAVLIGPTTAGLQPYSWDEISDVRSGLVDDNGEPVPVVSLRFDDETKVPVDPASAAPDPPWLHMFADDWAPQGHLIAPIVQQARPVEAPVDELVGESTGEEGGEEE